MAKDLIMKKDNESISIKVSRMRDISDDTLVVAIKYRDEKNVFTTTSVMDLKSQKIWDCMWEDMKKKMKQVFV